MIKYRFIDKHAIGKNGADLIQNAIVPLLARQWNDRGRNTYGLEMSVNLQQFMTLWVSGALTMVLAYDGERPVGLFIGIAYRPMMFDRQVLMVENCWGVTPEITKGLYKYVLDLLAVMNVDELWVQDDLNDVEVDGLRCRRTVTTRQYVRD